MLTRGLGIFVRGGAQKLVGSCVPKWIVGKSLCTVGDGVDKFPMQHNYAPKNHFRDFTCTHNAAGCGATEKGAALAAPCMLLPFVMLSSLSN